MATPKRQEVEPTRTGTALEVVDFGDDAGAGMEGARQEELLTPFIGLLQPLSPQLERGNPVYNPDARPGMFHNTLTGEVFDGETGLDFVPVARDYQYGMWIPRDLGGGGGTGFRGTLSPDSAVVREAVQRYGRFRMPRYVDGRWTGEPHTTENGEEVQLVEQFNLFAMVAPPPLDETNAQQIVMAFTSTKIKVYTALFTRIAGISYPVNGRPVNPPIWAHHWRVTSVSQKNKKGTFYNYRFDLAGGPEPIKSLIRPNEPLYQMAKAFSEMIRAGRVKADYGTAGREPGSDEEEIPL